VGKVVIELTQEGGIDNHLDEAFDFVIEYADPRAAADPNDYVWQPYGLGDNAAGGNFASDGGAVTDGPNGEFQLYSTETALIWVDADMVYRLTELFDRGYSPAYALARVYPDPNGDKSWITEVISTNVTDPNWQVNGEGPHITEIVGPRPGEDYMLLFSNTKYHFVELSVGKVVAGNVSVGDRDGEYWFEVVYIHDLLGLPVPWPTPWTIPLSVDEAQTEAMYIEGIAADQLGGENPTQFMLRPGQTATIYGLPAGQYLIRELSAPGFNVSYAVDGGKPAAAAGGETGVIAVADRTEVLFTNNKPYPPPDDDTDMPKQPASPDKPIEPETPEEPEEPNTPVENGATIGEWRWDENTHQWISHETQPMGNLPSTGDFASHNTLGFWLWLAASTCAATALLVIAGLLMWLRRHKQRLRNGAACDSIGT
jgi:hypothetical protein